MTRSRYQPEDVSIGGAGQAAAAIELGLVDELRLVRNPVNTRDIDIVSRNGSIIGRISGSFNPRGLLFTTLAGNASLLFSDVSTDVIRRAGPEDIVPND